MAWVDVIPDSRASGEVTELYARSKARAGRVPNIARLQSLRATTALRGFELYGQIMDSPTGITRRERVLIATVVSKINGCFY